MHRIRWDDLQILRAVAQSGSASAAAGLLGINHATVLRRVSAFEDAQGVKLFVRHPTGFRATEAGVALLGAAERMHDAAEGIQRELRGQDGRLSGIVQLTTTDTIVSSGLTDHIARFREQYPEITVNLTMTNRRLDIARLDAEVSIRPSRNPPEQLIGRRACGLSFAAYVRSDRAVGEIGDVGEWIGIANELRNSPVEAWVSEFVTDEMVVARADSFAAIRELARTGIGAAVLPCCLGDPCAQLIRVGGPIKDLETSLWVLTHPDLKTSAKVAALSDFLAKALRGDRKLMEGRLAE